MNNLYIKIPIHTYKGSELNNFERVSDEGESEIEKLKKTGLNYEPEEIIRPVITWMRIPLDDFAGVIYDSTTAIENADEEFDSGDFTSSMLMFADGFSVTCAWTVEQLEDKLIEFGVVSPLVRQQKEKIISIPISKLSK